MVVQLVPKHVEQGYDWHVEKKEGNQTSRAEEPEKGIHPNSNWQVHPYDPIEQGGKKVPLCLMCYLVPSCLIKRTNVQLMCTQGKLLVRFPQKENTPRHSELNVFMEWTLGDIIFVKGKVQKINCISLAAHPAVLDQSRLDPGYVFAWWANSPTQVLIK